MERKEENDYGKDYCIGAMKGGVGKSVSTSNLAYSLAEFLRLWERAAALFAVAP